MNLVGVHCFWWNVSFILYNHLKSMGVSQLKHQGKNRTLQTFVDSVVHAATQGKTIDSCNLYLTQKSFINLVQMKCSVCELVKNIIALLDTSFHEIWCPRFLHCFYPLLNEKFFIMRHYIQWHNNINFHFEKHFSLKATTLQSCLASIQVTVPSASSASQWLAS